MTLVFCAACTARELSKPKSRTIRAPLGTILAGFPFDVVAMDIMGPFPRSRRGNQHLLVVGDYFSKWLSLIPLVDQTASTVAGKFVDVFVSQFGVPCQLHTDQGPCFESKLLKELCSLLNIAKTRTTPYRPQSDRMVERANRTVKSSLRAFVTATNQVVLDEYLPFIQMAYNSSVHAVTGFTPHSVLFGRETRLPGHILFLPSDANTRNITVPEFVRDCRLQLAEAAQMVK